MTDSSIEEFGSTGEVSELFPGWYALVRVPTEGACKPFHDMASERIEQSIKWGEQHHPDGTDQINKSIAEWAKLQCARHAAAGTLTWTDILTEEFYEALAETDPVKLRAELVQVAAVAAAWIEDIDGRPADA